jgi:hypothetical protein
LQSAKRLRKFCALLILSNAQAHCFVPSIFAIRLFFSLLKRIVCLRETGAAVGTTVAQSTFVMNTIDFFIIYLACGAPFAVYYFLQNRNRLDSRPLWLTTLLNFIFWMPAAFLFLSRSEHLKSRSLYNFNKTSAADARRENLQSIQKQIEKSLPESDLKISIYEFRETIERYVGLTLANQMNDTGSRAAGEEFFRVAQTNNVELGAICLNRRNRNRLSLHQTEARNDFLHLINQLLNLSSDEKNLEQSAIKLAEILEDRTAQNELEKLFARSQPVGKRLNAPKTENELWKPEAPKPSPAKPAAYHSPALKAMPNLRSKD